MSILLPALGVAFAGFCVWLGVRIINRREQWAKWTLAAVVALPVLYALSFGPACWISSRLQPSGELVSMAYSPIIPVMMWQEPIPTYVANSDIHASPAIIPGVNHFE